MPVCGLAAGGTAPAALDEVRACLAANLPHRSSEFQLKLDTSATAGWSAAHEGRVYWRRGPEGGSQTLLCMTAPRDVRGLAYLIHEGDAGQAVWAYLPAERRTVRINTRSAATRTHISRTAIRYEDLRYLPFNLAEAESRAAEDAKVGDRDVSVVELALPTGADSSYERVVARVDRDTCVPLEIEFWETGGRHGKTLRASPETIETLGTTRIARTLRVEDHVRQVVTHVIVEEAQIDAGLADRLFATPLRAGQCPGAPP